jgi:hypothetical protein
MAYATATKETSDTQAKPESSYGKTVAGVTTAIKVTPEGKMKLALS